jgi:hypothetical protein
LLEKLFEMLDVVVSEKLDLAARSIETFLQSKVDAFIAGKK